RQCALAALFGIGAAAMLIWVRRRWVFVAMAALFAIVMAAALFLQWQCGLWWNWLVPGAVQLPLAALLTLLCPRLPVVAFISYRRKGGDAFALALLNALRLRGDDALLDVEDLGSGEFPPQLLKMIEC